MLTLVILHDLWRTTLSNDLDFFTGKIGSVLSDVTKLIVSVFPSKGERTTSTQFLKLVGDEDWEEENPRQLR